MEAETKGVKVEHTPGPWCAAYNGHYWDIRIDERRPNGEPHPYAPAFATVFDNIHAEQTSGRHEANARLIAAAPCLYAALLDLVNLCDDENGSGNIDLIIPTMEAARDALARAEGRDA